MQIALFSECYTPVQNGVVTSIRSLRNALIAQGHSVHVFASGTPQADDDAAIHRLPALPFPRHPYRFARPFPHVACDFRSLRIDVVHCQHPFTIGQLGASIARRYGLPMVYTAHSLYDAMASYAGSPIIRRVGQPYARHLVRSFCGRAALTIAPSVYAQRSLRAIGVREEILVIPSGVAPRPAPLSARDHVRASLGIGPDEPLVLYVGRLGPEKRVDLLLQAVSRLRPDAAVPLDLAFRVAVVGDGQCRKELERLSQTLELGERVRFTGSVTYEEVAGWYAAADIFALPSPAETQGLVLVEAMAAGIPSISVDRGGAPEVVISGKTGLISAFTAQAFAIALRKLLLDAPLRAEMGARAREGAILHGPEQMAAGVMRAYEAAIRRGPVEWKRAAKAGRKRVRATL